jgi:hypothetical protein
MRVKLDLQISSENAAFQDGMHSLEVARIVRELGAWLSDGAEGMFDLLDVNGNCVGQASFEAWEEEA